jgi:hypothetical protein
MPPVPMSLPMSNWRHHAFVARNQNGEVCDAGGEIVTEVGVGREDAATVVHADRVDVDAALLERPVDRSGFFAGGLVGHPGQAYRV